MTGSGSRIQTLTAAIVDRSDRGRDVAMLARRYLAQRVARAPRAPSHRSGRRVRRVLAGRASRASTWGHARGTDLDASYAELRITGRAIATSSSRRATGGSRVHACAPTSSARSSAGSRSLSRPCRRCRRSTRLRTRLRPPSPRRRRGQRTTAFVKDAVRTAVTMQPPRSGGRRADSQLPLDSLISAFEVPPRLDISAEPAGCCSYWVMTVTVTDR